MKHIKLFEDYKSSVVSRPAQLLVTGDWKGITEDGTPLDFIAPATFNCRYLPPGSSIPSGYEKDAESPYSDLEFITEYVLTGDQSGVNVAPKDFASMKGDNSQRARDMRKGLIRLFIDPAIDPSRLELYLKRECYRIWGNISDKEYYGVDSGDYGDLDPKYLKLAMEDKPFPRKVVFNTRLYTTNYFTTR
jgi:hypothetical protein